jgi:oxalate decarboxylase/phosphoglucose isomerase-like protein (cupin superfamily)
MTATTNGTMISGGLPVPPRRLKFTHDVWMDSLKLPVHQGYYIPDLRALELARWEERGCDAAFIQLEGQQGITETRVSEVPAREVLPPVRLAFDEVVYVVQGRGATTVWRSGGEKKSFEWGENSMFLLPRNHFHQFSNTSGSRPARLLHYNYFPLLLSAAPEPEAFITTDRGDAAEPVRAVDLEQLYAEPALKQTPLEDVSWKRRGSVWVGSFFPDMSAWDKLTETRHRGAGGRSVAMEFPGSEISCHMSMFPPQTYKKAHRHGPGRAIVIPAGEGYSVMWEEGKDKVIAEWKPGSLITPPNKWFHQHFNTGVSPARYLAFHPPLQFDGHAEKVEDRARDQIEYVDEDPAVRGMFESELSKRGLRSVIPEEAYSRADYQFETVKV